MSSSSRSILTPDAVGVGATAGPLGLRAAKNGGRFYGRPAAGLRHEMVDD